MEAMILVRHMLLPLTMGLAAHFSVEPRARHWHRTLRKSHWTPPPVAFPLVWLGCYLNLGFATYRAAAAGAGTHQAVLYLLHLVLVNTWNPVFFALRRLRAAASLLAVIVTTTPFLIYQMATWDTLSALVLLPYYCWLLLLAHLSFYMAEHNPGPHFGPVKDELMNAHDAAPHCKAD